MDKPVLGLKWVGEGNEEETVDTEDRLFNNKKNHLKSDRLNEDEGFTLSQMASKKKRAKPGTFFSQCHLLDTVPSDQ